MNIAPDRFEPTPEQRLFGDSVARFIEDAYPFEQRRSIVESGAGFLDAHWEQFAALGWLALPIPERFGGLGGSPADVAVLMEAFGRALVVSPFLASSVLAARTIIESGDEAACESLLPAIAAGEARAALAYAEPQSRYDPFDVATTAVHDGQGWRIDGIKSVVLFAQAADHLVVTARTAGSRRDRGGISLFRVDPAAPGVASHAHSTHDGGRASEVRFTGVRIGPEALLGTVDGALPGLERALDVAAAATCAEACGAMWASYERTLEYANTREQFGATIGSFQAISHRLVDVFMKCQLARSMVHEASEAAASGDPVVRARGVSAAKHQIGLGARDVCAEGIQIHGGVGMTTELPVGHHFKRITAINATFGDPAWHLARYRVLTRTGGR